MTVQEIWALGNFYNSVFSGEQIDSAIGVILNGGIDAAVEDAEAAAAAAAKSAKEAAGSAAGLGDAATNAKNSATQAAESAEQARIYASQAHAIAGEGLVFSVNNVQADETGNVPLGADNVGAISVGEKGAAGGVAELDGVGKVPAAQLPATMTPAAHAETHKKGGEDELTAADIDAAPAGYGLGGIGKPLTSADDINTIWQNGWYYWWTDIPANAPLDRAACGMRVYDSHTNGTQYKACQAVRIMNSGNYNWHNTVFRTIVVDKVSGKSVYVSEWEYLTPMMDAGVEYRTTERYQGKAVYTKLVDCGYLPNSASKNVPHGITDATEYVSIRLRASYDRNGFELVFTDQNSVNIVGDNIQIKTNFNTGGYKATVTVKYTKD